MFLVSDPARIDLSLIVLGHLSVGSEARLVERAFGSEPALPQRPSSSSVTGSNSKKSDRAAQSIAVIRAPMAADCNRATRGRFDVAMVWAPDRLGRSLADLIRTSSRDRPGDRIFARPRAPPTLL